VILILIFSLFNNDNNCNNPCDVCGTNTCGNVLGTNTSNNGGFEWIWILVIIFLLFGLDDNNCNQNVCNPC